MADREIDINLTNSTDKSLSQIPTPAELKEFEARVARVMDRGIVVDRLHVDLPPEWHGEWVPLDTAEIARMELLGFKIDDTFAPKRKLHDQGDGKSIVGDVVHMIQPKWMHEIIEKKRLQRYIENHGKRNKQKEEADFLASQATIGEEKNTVVASTAETRPGHELTNLLTQKE